MKKTITFFKNLLLAVVLLVGSGSVRGQGTLSNPIFQEDFGTLSNGTVISTSNTTFNYVRVSASTTSNTITNKIVAKSPSSISTGASGLIGSKGTSLSGVGITNTLTSFTSGTVLFTFKTPASLTSAVMLAGVGVGSTFTGNGTFTGNDLAAAFQVAGTNLQIREGGAWKTVQTVNVSTTYTVTLVFNNTAGVLTYGNNNSLPSNKVDVWINGTKSSTQYGAATNSKSSNGFRIYTTTSEFEVDDIAVYNSLPAVEVSAPITQSSAINFPNVDQNGMTASWTNGDGAKRVVIMNTSNSFTAPTDGTDPTANAAYGGSGEQVVYNGTGTSVAVTGLSASTTYYFRAYEYNGSGSTTKYLAITGTDNPNSQLTNAATSPVITIAGTINEFVNTVLNSNSAEQSYTLQGANLTGDVTVTPPAGFEISKSSGSGFVANPSTLTFTSGEIASAQNVYVRFAPTAAQAYSGNITHISNGATQVDKAVSGTGVYAEPTDQPTGFTATANSVSQITVNWTDATGGQVPAGYLVKASTGTSATPVDGIAETAGTLVKIVAQGAETAVFTGLSASTTYNFSIWPYTNSGSSINYKTDGTVVTGSATTETPLGVPVATAATDISATGFTANWGAAASATGYDVNVYTKTGGSGSVSVTQGFDAGTTAQTDWIFTAIGGTYTSNDNFGASSPSLKFDNDADAVLTPTLPSSATELSFWMKGQGVSDGSSLLIEGYNGFNWVLIHNIVNPTNTGITYLYTSSTTPALPSNLTQFRFTYTKETGNIAFDDVNYKYGSAAENIPVTDSPFTVASSTNKVITSLNPGTEYFYTVVAKNASGSSAASNEISVTTPKITFTGTGEWTETARWNTGTVPGTTAQVVVDGAATINSNVEVAGLTINAGKSLTVNAAKQLTISGAATNNGTIIIQSDENGTGTIVGNVSGAATVQQYLPGDGRQWWYLSSPVTGATSNVFAPTASANKIGTYVEDYLSDGNEATTSPYYTNPYAAGSSTPLSVGKGYVVKLSATTGGTYTFEGTLNNGDYTLTPTRTGVTAGKRGFNLVGNPYPSYLDWDAAYADAATSNVSNAIWYRTYLSGKMVFHTYADEDGVPATVSGIIPPAQAFWIRVNADGSNGTITFKNTHRSHAGATANPLKAPKANDRPRVRLQISNGVNADEALIVAKSYASNGIDSYDIEKMSNDNVDVPEIYTLLNNQDMVINSFNSFVAGQEIALGMRPGKAGDFTINATQFENIPSDIKVILKDKFTEAETELSENASYSFNADGNEANQRFSLLFRAPGSVTGIDNAGNQTLFVYAQPSEIVVNGEELKGSNITVYTATGQSVMQVVAAGNREVLNGNFTPGVYFVKVNNTVKKVSVK